MTKESGNTADRVSRYNRISALPQRPIDLGDGRTLCVEQWVTSISDDPDRAEVIVFGHIRLNKNTGTAD